jgi:hypothetical protein
VAAFERSVTVSPVDSREGQSERIGGLQRRQRDVDGDCLAVFEFHLEIGVGSDHPADRNEASAGSNQEPYTGGDIIEQIDSRDLVSFHPDTHRPECKSGDRAAGPIGHSQSAGAWPQCEPNHPFRLIGIHCDICCFRHLTGLSSRHGVMPKRQSVYDIDAMALAVPYCDVVVTEKACHHALISTGMDTRMNTVLLRDLRTLVSTLKDWNAA